MADAQHTVSIPVHDGPCDYAEQQLQRVRALASANVDSLPDELWCSIWELLPIGDMLSVCHVCARWRRLSRATPYLWSRISFHSDYSVTWDTELPLTNIRAIPLVLQLSGITPIHLYVNLSNKWEVLQPFSELMRPHGSRIATIRWQTWLPDTLATFLANFDSLPHLTSLTCTGYNGIMAAIPTDIFTAQIALPRLEAIYLQDLYRWPPAIAIPVPSVASLHMRPYSPRGVIDTLAACPNVRTLCLELSALSPGRVQARALEDLRNAIGSLTSLTSIELRDPGVRDRWVLPVFYSSRTRRFSMLCRRPWDEFESPCGIFGDLGESVHISCTRRRNDWLDEFVIQATDGDQRMRRVAGLMADFRLALSSLWSVVDCGLAGRVVRLSVDVALWSTICEHPARGMRVTSLELIIRHRRDVEEYTHANVRPEIFPVLETVSIQLDPERDLPFSLRDMADFMPRLGLVLPISNVVLNCWIAREADEILPSKIALRTNFL